LNTIYSIGHSNVPFERMLEKLKAYDIEVLVDVRTSPRSRWPQYTVDNLREALEKAGIHYKFRGKNLGGKGGNVDFHETIDELTDWVRGGEKIAVMCSEGNPDQCHRKSMLAPEFKERGIDMFHILYEKKNSNGQVPLFAL
jgi:uncharacterized protein (DUF488 family)